MEIIKAEEVLNKLISEMDEIGKELNKAYLERNSEKANTLAKDFKDKQERIFLFAETLKQDVIHIKNGMILH